MHIVCLDAPSPPDYGGAIDMYYKIKALTEAGIKIILHYFDYKKNRNVSGLEIYCHKIISYKRKSGLQGISYSTPYIVASRINRQLIDNLNADAHPILLEGIHTTGIVPYLDVPNRKVIVRMHNDEAVYYRQLAKSENNIFKKIYYEIESRLLEKKQRQLPTDLLYACLSTKDQNQLGEKYHWAQVTFLPAFIPWQHVNSKEGNGNYCLYHGNLSVPENEKAVKWLIKQISNIPDILFVIAGKNPSKKIKALAALHHNVQLIINPADEELEHLIKEAHIHLLPSLNSTGIKIKLLHALFTGRFCITNTNGVAGSALNDAVIITRSGKEMQQKVMELMNQPFTALHIEMRKEILTLYNNDANAQLLSAWIY